MPNEPIWVPIDEIIETNRDAVSLTGEPFLIRDMAALQGAWARPQQHWAYGERDMATLAVSLLFAIALNHPFLQGNKRPGFISAIMFLQANGFDTDAGDELAGERVLDVLEDRATKDDFANWFRRTVFSSQ